MPASSNILVVGVGNILLTDDGIGVHVVGELQKETFLGVEMLDAGTAILHALPWVEKAGRVLIIDAAQGGEPPGTIYFFEPSRQHRERSLASIHALGICEALWLMSPQVAPHITVLGVEPQCLDYGMELSPSLQAALPRVVAAARQTIQSWLRQKIETRFSSVELEPHLV